MAFHNGIGIVVRKIDFRTQTLQRLAHVTGIVTFQEIVERGRPFSQSGYQKNTIGDTLGTR
jgi:hypothetical protein